MFTEKVEQAKKELSPLMQEVRKYIPQAEYGYHVVSGEYPAFYGVRIEFTSTATTSKGRAANTKSRAISACSPPRK